MGAFADSVFEVVCRIPRGMVATYGQVARLVGRPRSARYVGYALRANPRPGTDAESVPCHRVVFKDGSLCKSFAFGGPDVQFERLRSEGVLFSEARHESGADTAGVRIVADLGDGAGEHPVLLDDIRVRMDLCQWDGRPADEGRGPYPAESPAGFDWKAEMGD